MFGFLKKVQRHIVDMLNIYFPVAFIQYTTQCELIIKLSPVSSLEVKVNGVTA